MRIDSPAPLIRRPYVMLAFVIPVKHPARSQSYERVTDLLRNTLASVGAQTDSHFVTIVVLALMQHDYDGTVHKEEKKVDA